jgi:hypothetical protein
MALLSAGKCPVAPLPGSFHKLFSQEIFLHLAGNFCYIYIYTYNTLTVEKFQKHFASRDCLVPRLKFVTMCGTIHSLKSAYARSFMFDLHRKFLFSGV